MSAMQTNPLLNLQAFMSWNGPSVGTKSEKLIEASLNKYFLGRPWHFYRRSKSSQLKQYGVSKVVDKKESTNDRMDPSAAY